MHNISEYLCRAARRGCLPVDRTELISALDDEDADFSCIARRNPIGHFTASAIILDSARGHALMVHHKTLRKVLFPGGHIDPREDAMIAAFREIWEETGYNARPLLAFPVDVDSHDIPANPAKNEGDHRHHDLLFLGEADRMVAPIEQLEEVDKVEWITLDEIAARDDPRMPRVIATVRRLLSEM